MHDAESIHRLLLDCGFRDAAWPPRGPRRWSVVGKPVAAASDVEIVIGCVGEARGFHLQVQPAAARDWVVDVLEQHGASQVPIRAASSTAPRASGPWLAAGVGLSALALYAWSLLSS
jgi:hypothetical protein